MTDDKEKNRKTPLKLSSGTLEIKKTVESGQVRQSFSHGRSKAVAVEVRKKRTFAPGAGGKLEEVKDTPALNAGANAPQEESQNQNQSKDSAPKAEAETVAKAKKQATKEPVVPIVSSQIRPQRPPKPPKNMRQSGVLTNDERALRMKVLQDAMRAEEDAKRAAEEAAKRAIEEEKRRAVEEELRRAAEAEAQRLAEEEAARKAAEPKPEPEAVPVAEEAPVVEVKAEKPAASPRKGDNKRQDSPRVKEKGSDDDADTGSKRVEKRSGGAAQPHKPAAAPRKGGGDKRREGRLTITAALDDDDRSQRGRSLAAVKRARERERAKQMQKNQEKIVREVTVPEMITVQELANRMAERGADVIKCLMRNGIMATINQNIDADTAELVASEFGHTVKRVADSDVEIGLEGIEDQDDNLMPRPPVVTVMGHVDHGKTSLLDALRSTDVVSGEAGGITQHIGAYQVTLGSGEKITFIDTPGHEAFTQMRARGAKVTDIVILVVAADDGIMPQTIEAIRHAKAAQVPIIVAINKIDKPGANPDRVRQELLQHELVTEDLGGDVLTVEVSAKKRINLDKLQEAILLQAEILDLKANPDRQAQGAVIEAKMERGRGSVATVLVQRGTLHVGDVFVAGAEWGRVRALVDDRGNKVDAAGPSAPVEILGLQGTPSAGDDFVVVENEMRAREVADYRQRRAKDTRAAAGARGTLEQMFTKIAAGEVKELPVVIKGDVQGSVEAIVSTLEKMGTDEVKIRVLHAAVGGINESDVTLAHASEAVVIGFNVRANPQARDLAKREAVDIRYYSIIYDVADDLRKALSGMLAPTLREHFLGNAEIREIFSISKVGNIAGCRVTEGMVKRGAKVRLLRDNVVVHEGKLSQLRRFKDDVKEVQDGYECGMSFENYNDIRVGDVIECFEIEEVAATL